MVCHSPRHGVAAVQGDLLNHRGGQVLLVAGALYGVAAGQAVEDLLIQRRQARRQGWGSRGVHCLLWQELCQGQEQE